MSKENTEHALFYTADNRYPSAELIDSIDKAIKEFEKGKHLPEAYCDIVATMRYFTVKYGVKT